MTTNYVNQTRTPPLLDPDGVGSDVAIERALADLRAYALALGAATQGTVKKITLSAAAEAADAIVVSGQVEALDGSDVTSAVEVMVRTLAVTDDKGDITVTVGTERKTVNPATGENISWITTTAAGAFAFSVANDVAEVTLVSVSTNGALTANLRLTFAA